MVRAQALRLRRRIADQLAGLGRARRFSRDLLRRQRCVQGSPTRDNGDHGAGHRDISGRRRTNDEGRLALALGGRGLMIGFAMAATAASIAMTAPGPQGPLAGTLLDGGAHSPVVLIIPGSGPTDRDGNNPLGITAAPYRMLAEALAQRGVSTVRIDKRGMFASKAAVADPNKVTIGDYARDTHNWVAAIRKQTGANCVWVLGHSEGALVALAAAQKPDAICGAILVSG